MASENGPIGNLRLSRNGFLRGAIALGGALAIGHETASKAKAAERFTMPTDPRVTVVRFEMTSNAGDIVGTDSQAYAFFAPFQLLTQLAGRTSYTNNPAAQDRPSMLVGLEVATRGFSRPTYLGERGNVNTLPVSDLTTFQTGATIEDKPMLRWVLGNVIYTDTIANDKFMESVVSLASGRRGVFRDITEPLEIGRSNGQLVTGGEVAASSLQKSTIEANSIMTVENIQISQSFLDTGL